MSQVSQPTVCGFGLARNEKELGLTHRPRNVTLALLPPYSPELNPVERVWLYLRERFLSLRVLDDHRGHHRRLLPSMDRPHRRTGSYANCSAPIHAIMKRDFIGSLVLLHSPTLLKRRHAPGGDLAHVSAFGSKAAEQAGRIAGTAMERPTCPRGCGASDGVGLRMGVLSRGSQAAGRWRDYFGGNRAAEALRNWRTAGWNPRCCRVTSCGWVRTVCVKAPTGWRHSKPWMADDARAWNSHSRHPGGNYRDYAGRILIRPPATSATFATTGMFWGSGVAMSQCVRNPPFCRIRGTKGKKKGT